MKNRFGITAADLAALASADMEELRGIGDSPVALRIRTEEPMQRAALHLLARMGSANDAVAAVAASAPPRAIPRSTAVRNRRRTGALLLSGGLAAAAVASVMLLRTPDAPVNAPRIAEPSITATLNASSSRPFAVIPTDNPDIAIVWLFPKETP